MDCEHNSVCGWRTDCKSCQWNLKWFCKNQKAKGKCEQNYGDSFKEKNEDNDFSDLY